MVSSIPTRRALEGGPTREALDLGSLEVSAVENPPSSEDVALTRATLLYRSKKSILAGVVSSQLKWTEKLLMYNPAYAVGIC